MPTIGKLKAAKIVRHQTYGTPHKAYAIQDVARKGTPRAAAQAFLKTIAKELKIKPDLSDLKFDKVIESPLGTHVLFQQYHNKKPITGAWVKVDLDHHNRAYHFSNNAIPQDLHAAIGKTATKDLLTERAALKKALAAVRATKARIRGKVTSELVNYPVGKTTEPAWKFLVAVCDPAHDWRIYISARNGSLLHKEDMLKTARGHGLVFDPNPVVTLNDIKLRNKKPVPDAAYRQVELPDIAATGFLDGPYVNTRLTKKRVRAKDRKFPFKRNKPAFKEVMVYFHIDRVQRYIQSLGFKDVNRRSISVDIAAQKDDNSFYSPVDKALHFGTGGVDDAEDAEIIVHEYGHSIQDAQVPGFGSGREAGAMGEGFGDYLAASFFADMKPARFQKCVGSWDATSYSRANPPYLRRLDSKKRYPKDIEKEVHSDGEIWSACLWQIREHLGRHPADKLILSHHFLIARNAHFEDAALALIMADQQLNAGANEAAIRDIFTRRGILASAKSKRASRGNRPRNPVRRRRSR
jgi:Zn-dependent metalloprotease